MLRFGGRLYPFELLGGNAEWFSSSLSGVERIPGESTATTFSSLSRSLSLSIPVGTSTRWLGDVGETGDAFPGFGDRRPLMLYVGLKGTRSELTEMEEFLFSAARGERRPFKFERPEKLRSSGDETGPTVVSTPFWGEWSPVPFEGSGGSECKGLSTSELEPAHPLCWNGSPGLVEEEKAGGSAPNLSGIPCGEGGISFWNPSRNGDWRRGESRVRQSGAYLGESDRLEFNEVTEDLLWDDSMKTEGSKAIAGLIDCLLAARDVGGCKEPFGPLAKVLVESFISICRGRTPSSRLVRRSESSGRGTVSPEGR